MKAKVVIENGETTIILTPENEFERDVIEKVYQKKEKHSIYTSFEAEDSYGILTKHKVNISIKEIRP